MTPNNESLVEKKAKGGRQRQFSNEQRKDRNREAQAAFRERRSKHTKALEDTITDLRTMVEILQQNALQAKERADKAEKRCQLLENQCQHLKMALEYISPTSFESPSTRPSPMIDSQQWPTAIVSTCTTDTGSWPTDSGHILMNDWNKDLSGSIHSTTSIPSLDEPLKDDTYSTAWLDQQLPLPDGNHYLGKSFKNKT